MDVLHALLERAAGFGVLALNDLPDLPEDPHPAAAQLPEARLADDCLAPQASLFRGRNNEVLYVGKAGRTCAAVCGRTSRGRTCQGGELLDALATIDHIVCVNDLEASIREVRLIQRPATTTGAAAIRSATTVTSSSRANAGRGSRSSANSLDDGAHYLGPFTSTAQAELVKDAIEDALPLRRCTQAIGARKRSSPACCWSWAAVQARARVRPMPTSTQST